MTLTWHIIRKDLRRMWLPVLLLLVFMTAGALWFRNWSPPLRGHLPSEIDMWGRLLEIWTVVLTGGQVAFTFLLTGALVVEDAVPGTTQFWITRPVSGGRLLLAKTLTAVACFVIAPVVIHLPIWWSVGTTASQIAGVAIALAALQGTVVLLALSLASLSRNIGGFFLGSVAVFSALVFSRLLPIWSRVAAGPAQSGYIVVCFLVVFAIVFVGQTLTRSTTRAWVGLAVGLAACVVVGARWPGWNPNRIAQLPLQESAGLQVPATFTVYSPRGSAVPSLSATSRVQGGTFAAPTLAISNDGRVVLHPADNWGNAAGLAALGVGGPEISWRLNTEERRPYVESGDNPSVDGSMEVWRARTVISGEIPLRVGAGASDSSGTFRIAAIERDMKLTNAIYVEERTLATGLDWKQSWWHRELDGAANVGVDVYYLVDRTHQRARVLPAGGFDGTRLNGETIGYRRLNLGSADWDDATLVRVRIVCDGRYRIPLSVHGVKLWQGEGT